jgi:hydroxymethylpyrimidine/phosphomethylpyrimidine kinase
MRPESCLGGGKALFFKKSRFKPISSPPRPMQTVLTIAGFDPSSGAGITADLMVFAAHSLFATSAITALTVQSTVGVRSMHPVSAEILRATLDCLDEDLPPAGIKIGMLATAANVAAVCDYLEAIRSCAGATHIPVVLDPVLRSSSGRELLDAEGVTLLRERLLPLVGWVTPNLAELSILACVPVTQRDDLPSATRSIQAQISGTATVSTLGILATGGHLDPPDDFLLTPVGEELWFPGERIETRATHGTGCALSSAFLSRLVLGDSPAEAAHAAKQYVASALRAATPRGAGQGPLHLLYTPPHPNDPK